MKLYIEIIWLQNMECFLPLVIRRYDGMIYMRFENNIVMRSEEELEKEQRLVFYFPNVKECNSSADSARHTCIT